MAWFSIPAAIVVICIGVVTYNWSVIRAGYVHWDSIDIEKPSYFSFPTAQALRALQAVRTDLETIANGSAVEPDALSFHIDVLISAVNIIARPSELNDRFRRLPGFSSDVPILSEFAEDVLPAIKPNTSSADARALLPRLEDISDTLDRVSKVAWDQDSELKLKFFETIQAGHAIILVIVGLLVCAILSFVIISIFYWWAIMAKTRALEEAEAAVADKISFLAMVSHELRTPLQVIVSALDVLERPQVSMPREFSPEVPK
ncbi:hypothetical protein G6L00_32215 [Agrobacterium rhizogenes]|nr:hypothetical protein [Rhizobium rhizogenes]NTH42816.1 hypothetical protein [Rhizobium rhizogenes]NTJ04964.1 hypothetical protein [Rhizobium rhizogenes]